MDNPSTDRLAFRPYTDGHKEKVIRLFTDPGVMKHVGDGVLTDAQALSLWKNLREDSDRIDRRPGLAWAVETRTDTAFVGHGSIRELDSDGDKYEIGFVLPVEAWGNGFGTEIARGLIRFAFDIMEQEAVYATVDDDHDASIRVLKKAGFGFHRYEYDGQGRYSIYMIEH